MESGTTIDTKMPAANDRKNKFAANVKEKLVLLLDEKVAQLRRTKLEFYYDNVCPAQLGMNLLSSGGIGSGK
jgi:hypothetical protein